MRHIESTSMAGFAAIYEPDIELVSLKRDSLDASLEAAARHMATKVDFSTKWSQAVMDSDSALEALEPHLSPEHAQAVATELNLAIELLSHLLECTHVGIRISTLDSPMCPKFHVDRVPCRLLITLAGVGTEWIPHGSVDEVRFADRASQVPPIKPDCSPHVVDAGAWALFKGGAWDEDFRGAVHRSPVSAEPRVLVSIDPLFAS